MMEGEKPYTKTGRMQKVDLPTICSWIVEVWEEIPSDIIRRASLKCYILNKMDGTEDDMLWENIEPEETDCHQDSSDSEADLMYVDDELQDLFQDNTDNEEFLGF